MISSHFGVLGALDPQNNKMSHLRHAFKAKKVTFWEVCRDFANSAIFAPKMFFLRNSKKFCDFPVSGPQNQFFRFRASKKAPRTLCLSLLLRRGRRSPILGPKERFWAPNNEMGRNTWLWEKKGEDTSKVGGIPQKYQVFPKENLMFWHVGNQEFHENLMISMKFAIFCEIRWKPF